VRRIGVLGVFLQTLALSGWTIGRNVRIDTRWATVLERSVFIKRKRLVESGKKERISRRGSNRVGGHPTGTPSFCVLSD
jgi:hypothetical protein